MKKFKAWAVITADGILMDIDWTGIPPNSYAKWCKSMWWWDVSYTFIQVEIREVKSKKRGKR